MKHAVEIAVATKIAKYTSFWKPVIRL